MRKSAFLLSFLLLFAAGCTPIEDYPLEIKAEMVGGLRPAYYFDVNAEGLLTVEVWRSQEQKDAIGPKEKQLDQETILQLKKLVKTATRDRGKEEEIFGFDVAMTSFTINGEEYQKIIYGWAKNKSLDKILEILIEQSPIPLVDFAGDPIKPDPIP